jgi:hypothetical protein
MGRGGWKCTYIPSNVLFSTLGYMFKYSKTTSRLHSSFFYLLHVFYLIDTVMPEIVREFLLLMIYL